MSELGKIKKDRCAWCDWAFTLLCSFAIFGGTTYFGTPWYVALAMAHAQTTIWFMLRDRD